MTTAACTPSPTDVQQPHILIVDDNDLIRLSLSMALEDVGARIVEASNGSDALVRAQHDPPDLVIADVDMPRMDGLTLSAALRADTRNQCVPIILMSATRQPSAAVRDAGANAFLAKPFSFERLRTLVNELIAPDVTARRCLRPPWGKRCLE